MLTISAFLITTASVLSSVWWACKSEDVPEAATPSEIASA